MESKLYHGRLEPMDIARGLIAEFNRGNLVAQLIGERDELAVQITTRPGATSGGQTALTITIRRGADGVLVQSGTHEWLGTAASLGRTTIAALANPWNLLHRLDDIAQDVENIQLMERAWSVVERTAGLLGAQMQMSETLRRVPCEYCGTANAVGDGSCVACGAPLGKAQPRTCPHCGFIAAAAEVRCSNCGQALPRIQLAAP
ncbi:MAG TPA: zinc ribbon domain-containing protein [Anaerolineales bacterium]|nr:zinc ribbon domain-containing protein [Anaerolineales bacterium]